MLDAGDKYPSDIMDGACIRSQRDSAQQILFRSADGSVVAARDVTPIPPKSEIVGIDINDKSRFFEATGRRWCIGARNARRICARGATYLSSRSQIKRAIPTR